MHHSDETKLKMSENSWTRKPGFYEKYYRTKVSSPSKYELFFSNLLKQRNINYIAQAVINNKFQVDFLIGNLIIEIDGEWHYQRGKLRFEDVVRDCQIRNWGYDIIHIKNKEVGLFES
jgi:very-short-patch-repair endonuclease